MQDKNPYNDKGQQHGYWQTLDSTWEYNRYFINGEFYGFNYCYFYDEEFLEVIYYAR